MTIHNAGGAPLSVTPSVELGALVLAQAGAPVTAPIEIPALESVTLSVTWTPTFGGAFTGRLSVSANDPSRGFTTINVIGFANAPRLSAPVANIDFGTVVQGWTTPARSFTLRNDGQGELTINSITFDQGSASQIRFVEVPTLPIKLSPNDPPISVSVIMDATILGTLGATVLVGSDGVDGPLGTGGVGRLEAGGVVVTCEQGCPIQNGTPSCAVDNECRIATCNTRFHNANNNINDGCECNEDPVNGSPNVFRDVGSQCGDTGVDLGTVSDSGSELIVTGTLHSLTDTDLYFIRFNDGSGNDYGARVRFLSGPSGMRIIPRFTDDSDPCGLPSGQAITPGQTREGGGCSSFLCTGNDSENGSFRVEWAPGASPQCGTYRISFDANANY